ncbi:MAG: hypothetical protein WDA75_18765 [Candidatus Latescibacterota bacterium]
MTAFGMQGLDGVVGPADYDFWYMVDYPRIWGQIYLEGPGANRGELRTLPLDLQQADVAAIREAIPVPRDARPDAPLYLCVVKVDTSRSYPSGVLTLAEEELSVMERRIWRYRYRQLHLVAATDMPGNVLFIEGRSGLATMRAVIADSTFEVSLDLPVKLSFRELGLTAWRTLASVDTTVLLVQRRGEWKISHPERLLGALHGLLMEE